MASEIFSIFGSIFVKTDEAQKALNNITNVATTVGKTMAAVFTGIGTSVATGLGLATKVGMNFEASMSQVAATMGLTAQEIAAGSESFKILSEAAKDAGAKTKYSASEAADALNYLALAGYSAEKAAETLPKILNLAAAGGLDLAYASDLVTDSMAALGIESNNLVGFTDELTKTSQKSNTSIGQLGEAILKIGGTAKDIKGGTVELNTVLGILADNGTKGSEAGTSLRNVLLSLQAPTDTARDMLKELGISVYDLDGNMRSLPDIMADFNKQLDNMTAEERTNAISTIFNKNDLKDVNALLGTSKDRWAELTNEITNAAGATEIAAKTMSDNLKGRFDEMSSALENLGIKVYEGIQEPIKNGVEGATKSIDVLSEALNNPKILESIKVIGESFGNLLSKIFEIANIAIPIMIDMFATMLNVFNKNFSELGSVFNGFSGYIEQIKTSFLKLFEALKDSTFLKTLIESFKSLATVILETALKIMPKIIDAFSWIIKNGEGIATVILGIVAAMKAFAIGASIGKLVGAWQEAVYQLHLYAKGTTAVTIAQGLQNASLTIFEGIVAVVTGKMGLLTAAKLLAAKAQTALNAAWLANPIGIVIGVITLLVAIIGVSFVSSMNKAKKAIEEAQLEARFRGIAATIEDLGSVLDPLRASFDSTTQSMQSHATSIASLGENYDTMNSKVHESLSGIGELGTLAGEAAEGVVNAMLDMGSTLVSQIEKDTSYQYNMYKTAFEKTGGVIEESEQKILEGIANRGDEKKDKIREINDQIQTIYDEAAKNTIGGAIQLTNEQLLEVQRLHDEMNAIADREQNIAKEKENLRQSEFIKDLQNGNINIKENYQEMLESIQTTETEGIASLKNVRDEMVATANVDLKTGAISQKESLEIIKTANENFGQDSLALVTQLNVTREAMKESLNFDGLVDYEASKKLVATYDELQTRLNTLKNTQVNAANIFDTEGMLKAQEEIIKTEKEMKSIETELDRMINVDKNFWQGYHLLLDSGKELDLGIKEEMQKAQDVSIAESAKLGIGTAESISSSIRIGFENKKAEIATSAEQNIIGPMQNTIPQMGDIGIRIMQGVGVGIDSGKSSLFNKIAGVAAGLLAKAKDALKIESPSKKFEDEVGTMIPAGMEKGITKDAKKVINAAEKLAKDTYTASKTWIENYRNDEDYLATEELKMWQSLSETYQTVSKQKVEIDKNIAKLKDSIQKEEFDTSKSWIDKKKFYGLLSSKEELESWERVQSRYAESSKQREDVDKEVFNARKKYEQDSFNHSKKWIDEKKYYGMLNLKEELEAWERIQSRYEAGDEKRTEADKAIFEVKKRIAEETKQITEETQKANDKMIETEKKYQAAVESRASSIYNSFGLFSEIKKKEVDEDSVTSKELTNNLKDQVSELQTWRSTLDSLTKKGLAGGLIDELEKMGPAANEELAALNSMSSSGLDDYVKLWEEKHRLAREQAIKELEPLKKETQTQIEELLKILESTIAEKGFKIGENLSVSVVNGMANVSKNIDVLASKGTSLLPDEDNETDLSKTEAKLTTMTEIFNTKFEEAKTGAISQLQDLSKTALDVLGKMVSEIDIFLVKNGRALGIAFFTELGNGLIEVEGTLLAEALRVADAISDIFRQRQAETINEDSGGSYATGLRMVPYDNFPARLHKGEGILTAPQNDEYLNGNSDGENITINQYFYNIKEEKTAFETYRETKKALDEVME